MNGGVALAQFRFNTPQLAAGRFIFLLAQRRWIRKKSNSLTP